jgi:hypothetical protein
VTQSRRKAFILSGLLGVLAVLLLRDRLPVWSGGRQAGGGQPAGMAAKTRAADADPDWDGLLRVATAPAPGAGSLDLFSPGRTKAPPAEGSRGPASRAARKEAVVASPPPVPEPPPPPPPDPVELRLAAARAELAAYRFVGVFRKSGGERVAFFAKGKDVVPLRSGDSIGQVAQVTDVRDAELVLVVLPDRKVRIPLKGNAPLSLPLGTGDQRKGER